MPRLIEKSHQPLDVSEWAPLPVSVFWRTCHFLTVEDSMILGHYWPMPIDQDKYASLPPVTSYVGDVMAEQFPAPMHMVSVYLIDRAYGGPEEGGWYYTYGEPQTDFVRYQREFPYHAEASAYREQLQVWLDREHNSQRRSDIGSVLSEGCYRARIDSGHVPRPFPTQRPHYE
jgi:hypothetical protein